MVLPQDYPKRLELNDEVHARPPEPLVAPASLAYLVLYSDHPESDFDAGPVRDLAEKFDSHPPEVSAKHFSADFGTFRFKWERHTEFTRLKFITAQVADGFFVDSPVAMAPEEWLSDLPGKLLVAVQVALVPKGTLDEDAESISRKHFDGNVLIGSNVSGDAGLAFTDFRMAQSGFSRVLVEDRGMTPRQAGRAVQRILEIDTYRMLALLALPAAQSLVPFLAESERELVEITSAMSEAEEADEPVLLDRLTRLEAAIEQRHSENHYRFSAAAAYYELVQRRIRELREVRVEGLQTFQEFMERRLAPAMNTCRTVSLRQESLSSRVARATQLLSTRVDISRQRQNQAVLASMNRRAKLQLRLQQTVEGLSVAAITYYVVSLVGLAAEAVASTGIAMNVALVTGISIPVVAILVAFGVRRVRKMFLPDLKT